MKKLFFLFVFLFAGFSTFAQTLYIKTYGNPKNDPIIFIHGGPSGNATLFEGTAAQKLSEKGFYVIAYDRRGEGRSADPGAKFTYQEAFDDLNGIFETYHLKKANILGHSFGGLVAALYSGKYPQKVKSLILAGALVSQQQTYDHILDSVSTIYKQKADSGQISKLQLVKSLAKNSAEYRKGCFELAGENGFFKVAHPSAECDRLYKEYQEGIFNKTNIRNKNAPFAFYKNESRNNIDTKPVLRKLKEQKVPLYAIYGKQDAIFSAVQITDLKNITGKNNFAYLDNCSHYLFVDQRQVFIDQLAKWLKPQAQKDKKS